MTDQKQKPLIEITAEDIMSCTCHEAYKSRGMAAPDCPLCNFGDDINDALNARSKKIAKLKAENTRLKSGLKDIQRCAGDKAYVVGKVNLLLRGQIP